MSKADLHIHSKYSNDGEFEIKDIIERCKKCSVDIFAISDHNSTRSLDEAAELTEKDRIFFIPAIEIDCRYKGIDLHLLGYNINWRSSDFTALENDVFKKVDNSISVMIDNLSKLGIDVDISRIREKANGGLPSGELIAEVLLEDEIYKNDLLLPYMKGGARSDMPYLNFYMDFFAQGKPAYVKIDYMNYENAVELIKSNGGTPIVAHPGLNFKGRMDLVDELLDLGAEGLEIFNNYHTDEQIDYLAAIAIQRDTIMTCGSDFHGKTKPTIEIGTYRFNNMYEDYLADSIRTLKENNF